MNSLSPDQHQVLKAMVEGTKPLLVLGAAGSGKSRVRDVYLRLNPRALLLGTTGASIAGTSGSLTVARFVGMSAKFLPPDLSTIIVEECSMLGSDDLRKLDGRLRTARKSPRLFGGARLVLVGDLLQLPPVQGTYFFTSRLYAKLAPEVHVLRSNHRQAGPLLQFCQQLRYGLDADTNTLLELRRPPPAFATVICATNAVAAKHNNKALDAWPGDPVELGHHKWKDGARVIVTRNIYKKGRLVIANGELGRLAGDAKVVCHGGNTALELPATAVQLGWAMTVHRAQGKTLDQVAIDGTGGMFAPHQLYVAVSRATSIDRLYINNVMPEDNAVRWNKELQAFARKHRL